MKLTRHLLAISIAVLICGTAVADDRYERALANESTAPNFVLVTIVDGRTGKQTVSSIPAPFLLGAIHVEYDIPYDEAGTARVPRIALRNRKHLFTFLRPEALQNVGRRYSPSMLAQVRDRLAKVSDDAILEGFGGGSRSLDSIYAAGNDFEQYAALRDAVAHVLLERGFLPGHGCRAGFLTVEK